MVLLLLLPLVKRHTGLLWAWSRPLFKLATVTAGGIAYGAIEAGKMLMKHESSTQVHKTMGK